MLGKVLFIVGLAGLVIAVAVLGISVLLPIVSDGRTSWSEAAWGIVPGAACSLVFFLLTLVGLFVALTAKK